MVHTLRSPVHLSVPTGGRESNQSQKIGVPSGVEFE